MSEVFVFYAIICQLEYKFDYLDGNKKPLDNSKGFLCTHDTIRTCDLRIRSPKPNVYFYKQMYTK